MMEVHNGHNAASRAEDIGRNAARQERERQLADPTAERAVLAAILRDATALATTKRHLVATDFYVPVHARAFEAMHTLHARGSTIDRITLGSEIGHASADALFASLPCDVNVSAVASYAAIVSDKARSRRLAERLAEALDHIERGDPRDTIARDIESALTAERRRAPVMLLKDALEKLIGEWENPQPCTSTGLRQLDELLSGGLRAGDMIGVAGTAGGGKSALVGQIALDAAKAGAVVLYASVEMPRAEVISRWLACESFRIVQQDERAAWAVGSSDILYGRAYRGEDSHGHRLESQHIHTEILDRIEKARKAIMDLGSRLFVEQIEPGSTVEDLYAMVTTVQDIDGNGARPMVLVVDPLQRFFASARKGRTGRAVESVNGNEIERVGAVAQELKFLADTTGIAVLFTSDTTKAAALNTMSSVGSLRGSYQINHLATIVLGLHTADTAEQLRNQLGDPAKGDAMAPDLSAEAIEALAQPRWWGVRDDATRLGARVAVLECSKSRRTKAQSIALGFVPGAACFVESGTITDQGTSVYVTRPRRGSKTNGWQK